MVIVDVGDGVSVDGGSVEVAVSVGKGVLVAIGESVCVALSTGVPVAARTSGISIGLKVEDLQEERSKGNRHSQVRACFPCFFNDRILITIPPRILV
jgi:hypothetical protein